MKNRTLCSNFINWIIVLLLLVSCSLCFSQEIHFQRIGVEEGLSQPTATSIYQDEFGVMWIGTKDGLNVYDGTNFKVFRPTSGDHTSLYNNNIAAVCGDQNGHIYVRCKYAVVEYDIKKNIFYTIRDSGIHAISSGIDNLWVGAKDSLFTYNSRDKKLSFYFTLPKIRTSCILESTDQTLYVGTINNGLYVIDKNKKWLNYLPGKEITVVYEDSKKNIWLGTKDDGLIKLDKSGTVTKYISNHFKNSISNNFVRCIQEDDYGNYWIGTFSGLDKLNIETGDFINYKERNKNYSLSHSSIICMTKDQQGTFWIGTYYGGVNLFNPDYEIYKYYYPSDSNNNQLSSPFVGRMLEDSKGNIWLATEGGGLNYLDRKTKAFTVYNPSLINKSVSSNNIQALYLDEAKQILWIGTLREGLDKLDLKTNSFTNYKGRDALINNVVRKIIPYKDQLILATHNGIGVFDPTTGLCKHLINDKRLLNRQIIDMMYDEDKEELWFSYSLGLVKYNLVTNQEIRYFEENIPESKIDNNLVTVIFKDRNKKIWVGTSGSGICLYNSENDKFTPYNSRNTDLINDYILDIKESISGYLLIATNQGLSRFDTDNEKFYNYNQRNGFPLTALNAYGLFVTSDNEIFLSGPQMMISFYEKELSSYVKPYQLNFTSIEVNNKEVIPNINPDVLNESLLYQPTIHLTNKHSILTLHYALSNYVSVLKNKIYYKLEGFDSEWIYAGYKQNVTYTNLNPGKYKFLIKCIEEFSGKESVFKELNLIVHPPFYKTIWAYCIYLFILILIVYITFNFYLSKLKLKASLEFEKKEKMQIEELNQSKLKFFTNISHEFRTPLTLIVSALEMLMERNDIQPLVYSKLVNVHRNTCRMKRLITELLDFRKQEQGCMQLKFSNQDIYAFLNEVYLSFKEYARLKHINLIFLKNDERLNLWFDVVQLEKVVYNLLSNAFKYTKPNDTISISIQQHANNVNITISDSGFGISEENINKIFDCFYQVNDTLSIQTGTGIGLALSKGIVEAHSGTITVHSKIDEGSMFMVELPLGDKHILDSQKITTPDIDIYCISELTINNDVIQDDINEEVISETDPQTKILVVEDNEELRELLVRLFSKVYLVYSACDGKEGFEMTKEVQPDIVLSDISMPIMSGIEMCRKIKTHFDTSHIPVILLTAQTAEELTIQGLKMGADDYITKPFNVKHLYLRCNNLVNSRRLLQKKYAKQVDDSAYIVATNSVDHQFLEQCILCIEEDIDNPNLDVNLFAQKMRIGRTKLFLKIKGITGQTPNDFILNIRLKKAQRLLKQSPSKTVSEIAYEVGFSSSSYFIKRFRELFGITPAQYQKE